MLYIASQTARAQQKAKPLEEKEANIVDTTGTCHKLFLTIVHYTISIIRLII
jgi:hypothetical protein